jgi:hypothetical protein
MHLYQYKGFDSPDSLQLRRYTANSFNCALTRVIDSPAISLLGGLISINNVDDPIY